MCEICVASATFDYSLKPHGSVRDHRHDAGQATSFLTAQEIASGNTSGKPSYDWGQAAAAISRDERKWDGGEMGTAGTVTYSFLSNAQAEAGYGQLSAAQIENVQKAAALWSQVANITFTWADAGSSQTYSSDGEIQFQAYDGNNSGWASYGWYTGGPTREMYTSTVSLGGEDFSLALHEIGHAIGLSHPGNYNGGGTSYANNADYFEDTEQFSVMSYFNGANSGADLFEWRYDDDHGWIAIGGATGLGLHDIAAIQRIYGATTDSFTGNTVYGFNSNTAGR